MDKLLLGNEERITSISYDSIVVPKVIAESTCETWLINSVCTGEVPADSYNTHGGSKLNQEVRP